jgi:signal transduction histidine kinase
VQDNIGFGMLPGGQLDVQTTLCVEARAARQPIAIDHASRDPLYCNHHTPRIYKIESYVSVPIVLVNGEYFGNLCAIDPRPAKVSDPRTVAMFTSYAELIARQLDSETSREATESALQLERNNAELREQFIAVLGHDLRTPLSAVMISAELLLRREDSAGVVEVARRIKASAGRMSKLIDDVLDFTRGRLESGIGVRPARDEELGSALRDVVSELRDAHPNHVIQEHIDIVGPVVCDRSRVQQLLSNLLGNALHHGDPQQPARVEAAIKGSRLVLEVSNAGPPIAPEHLARIFEPYWRPPSSQAGGGLGLGLHICRQIVDAHRGTMDVSSSADTGTRFTVSLPVEG